MPFWILIGAHFWFGERMSLQKFLGLLLGFCGVAVVFSDKLTVTDLSTLVGDLLSFVAGLLWAWTTMVIKGNKLSSAGAEKVLLYQLGMSGSWRSCWCRSLVRRSAMCWPLPAERCCSKLSMSLTFIYILWFWLM